MAGHLSFQPQNYEKISDSDWTAVESGKDPTGELFKLSLVALDKQYFEDVRTTMQKTAVLSEIKMDSSYVKLEHHNLDWSPPEMCVSRFPVLHQLLVTRASQKVVLSLLEKAKAKTSCTDSLEWPLKMFRGVHRKFDSVVISRLSKEP